MKHNRRGKEHRALLANLFTLLQAHRPIFGQERVYQRAVALALAELFAFGRHTVTQLMLTLGLAGSDWSAWYRLFSQARFKPEQAARVMLAQIVTHLGAEEPFVTGIDGFQVPRNSLKMPGCGWLGALKTAVFARGLHRAQRFVEGSWLTPMENGYSRAIPLRCLTAFTPKAVVAATPARKEREAGWKYLQWLRATLDQLGRYQQLIVALADGTYDTLAMWVELPKRVALVVRTPRNRVLLELPRASKGPGRPAVYGPPAPKPAAWLRKLKGFKRCQIVVRGRQRMMRYRIEGPFLRKELPHLPLFLIVIGGGKRPPGSRRQRYNPCFYLVSAIQVEGQWQLPLPPQTLLSWLWQRWELEVAHREMKSGLGLGEKQCWHPQGTAISVQWSVWLYGLLMLAGYRTWGLCGGPQPPGRWRKPSGRWSFNTLWRSYRAAFWNLDEFRASWTPIGDNWPKKEAFLASLDNAVLAAQRA